MLLDTDVMVDVLRGHPPAVAWLASVSTSTVALPGLVAMELLQGCRDMAEQNQLQQSIGRFKLHWPTVSDCERAYNDFANYRLSYNVGLLDCLIGETAIGLSEPLVTFNVKHYQVIPGLSTVQPYR